MPYEPLASGSLVLPHVRAITGEARASTNARRIPSHGRSSAAMSVCVSSPYSLLMQRSGAGTWSVAHGGSSQTWPATCLWMWAGYKPLHTSGTTCAARKTRDAIVTCTLPRQDHWLVALRMGDPHHDFYYFRCKTDMRRGRDDTAHVPLYTRQCTSLRRILQQSLRPHANRMGQR